ncbi:MAG: Maf family protein [Succinatimonas sp.]|nr:Maf family protein [Succinatimonas sp.]
MIRKKNNLILASGSPRRRELLSRLTNDFQIAIPNTDEHILPNEDPKNLVLRLSLEKALAVQKKYPDATILSADTVVTYEGRILGKPHDHNEAFEFLKLLNNRTHEVFTGICVLLRKDIRQKCIQTQVTFGNFKEQILKTYADSEEVLDKAGAYAIQGKGAFLVRSINGSASSVIGLPLYETSELLLSLESGIFNGERQ